jgi:hypothetical protein
MTEDPGQEIHRDLLKILGEIRGMTGGDLELQNTKRLWKHRDREKMRNERCRAIHGRYREIWRRFRKICQTGG